MIIEPVDSLALILVAGIGCQWLANRLHLPALILLLACGFLLGPATQILSPGQQFGSLLMPAVKLGVAIILFEGGLNLHFHELAETRATIRRLALLGIPIAWLLGSSAAHFIGGLGWPIASLFGAIIVVTGPTVILPLLRHAKLKQKPAALLKWEGIVNDPLGAVLAVLVFHWLIHDGTTATELAINLLWLLLAGFIGAATGYVTGLGFRGGQIAEHLKGPLLIAILLALFVITNHWLEDAGLVAVTAMGLMIGNMNLPSMAEIRRFKEYVTLILVSALFIVLTANIELAGFQAMSWHSAALIAAILFLVRPATILLATLGSDLTWRERLLPAWIAPRGIVAAAVAGVFAPELIDHQIAGAEQLVPLTFTLIVVTVILHGLTIAPWGRFLGLASINRNGILVVGASPWSSELCKQLNELGVAVLLTDSSWQRLRKARLANVPVYYGEILSPNAENSLQLVEMETLLALSDNDAYNALACTGQAAEMGWQRVYQLSSSNGSQSTDQHAELHAGLKGQTAFNDRSSYEELLRRHYMGWQFQKTRLTDNYDYQQWRDNQPSASIDLLSIKADGVVMVATQGRPLQGDAGDTLLSFVPASPSQPTASVQSKVADEKNPDTVNLETGNP